MGSMEEYTGSVRETRRALSANPDMRDLIRYATLAPNDHNTQAWLCQLAPGQINILPDYTRRTPVVDPDDHHFFVSLGAAAENLALASSARERSGEAIFNPADDGSQAMTTGDGLFAASSRNPTLPDWLGPFLFAVVFRVDADNDKYAQQMKSSAGVAVFVSERDYKEHWVSAGRACQRFALQATALGLKTAFVNQPMAVASLRPELAALVGLPGRRPDIVMRFGYGPTLPFSARRSVDAVLG